MCSAQITHMEEIMIQWYSVIITGELKLKPYNYVQYYLYYNKTV